MINPKPNPNIEEFCRRVNCDGHILILKGGLLVKEKPMDQLTVDLRYVEDGHIFIDRNNIVYKPNF